MSTTETVRAWATSNAGNAAADAAISSSDAQSPDTLDNNIRSIMTAVKKQMNDTGGSLVAGGTGNALTVTTGQVLESGQITDGLRILVKATADNTSTTVTFAPDGLTAANIKRADGSALAVGSIKSGMYLDLVFNSGSSEWRCANIAPININPGGPGIVLLASGTLSSAATLDLVLSTYTGYRGLKFVLSGFLPATDGALLWMRTSTDAGSTYGTTGYNQATRMASDAGNHASYNSGSDVAWVVSGVIPGATEGSSLGGGIGSGASEGIDIEVILLGQTSTTRWQKAMWSAYFIDSEATPTGVSARGGGAREVAQDTDAVRFMFSTGNIASGDYAVYGLA